MGNALKNISTLSLAIILLATAGCKYSYKQTKNEFDKESKIGRCIFRAGQMTENWFKEFKVIAYRSIGEDKDMSDEEKSSMNEEIKSLKFTEGEYLFFTMVNNVPILSEELPNGFTIIDKKEKEYVKSHYLFPLKIYSIFQYGVTISYNYTFIIRTDKIDMDNLTDEILPINLTIKYPNDKIIRYTVE